MGNSAEGSGTKQHQNGHETSAGRAGNRTRFSSPVNMAGQVLNTVCETYRVQFNNRENITEVNYGVSDQDSYSRDRKFTTSLAGFKETQEAKVTWLAF